MQNQYMNDGPILSGGCEGKAISWRAVFAGAVAAAGISLILMLLGAGLGLAFAGPEAGDSETVASFTAKMAIWLILIQWAASGLGGYLAGRLRTKWTNVHGDETFFRDTASGLVTWCVATLLTAALVATTASSALSHGGHLAMKAGMYVQKSAESDGRSGMMPGSKMGYHVGSLFRSATPQEGPAIEDAKREAGAILMGNAKNETLDPEDRTYLISLVSARTGISGDEAAARVDGLTTKIANMKAELKAKAEEARKASSAFSIFTALSMFLGAFIASVAAVIGGRERDMLAV